VIVGASCSAATIHGRRDERIKAGTFARLKQITLDADDRIVGPVLEEIPVDVESPRRRAAASAPGAAYPRDL
jgi:hypothetical protein